MRSDRCGQFLPVQSPAISSAWTMYPYLLAVLQLHFVFSGALPFDKRDTTNAGGTKVSWSEAVDDRNICRLNVSLPHKDGCNACSCIVGQPAICTLKLCLTPHLQEQLSKSFKKRCNPGDVWQEDCNKCKCTNSGHPTCTLNDCSSQTRLKRYLDTDPEEKKNCKPGSKWKVDCNTCYCNENGVPDCTLKACIKWERITKKTGLLQQLKDKLDENGKCIGKEIWEVDCNTCFCSEEGDLYCTRRHCTHRDKRASGKINAGGKCKPGDRWKLDECNNCVCTHTGYASCSLNDCASTQKRPKRSPAETGKINAGGKCKPGDRWKLDECNNCVCTHTGYASCSLNDCASTQKRPKRSPAETGKINAGGKCKPGDRWKLDKCNNCVCTHTGYASCSLNDCASTQKRPKRSPAETGKINAGGKCKPGDRWKLDECNNCVCTHTGYASCSLNDCASTQKRPKRSPAETGKINAGGKCKPGDRWKLDECNNCVCTHTGYASCSLNDCASTQKRPKRNPAETGKINAGGKCKPGDRWKLDECNNCVCTHTGYASCSLNDCASTQKRPKRSPAETGKINAGGKCKPGDRWKLDECNNCVCTHTGYASCSLNDCASTQKRPKRSPAETGKINAGGKCKPGDRWKLDECNNCVCTHTGYASCSLNDCASTQKRPKRSPAETDNEKPKSYGNCKPGEEWKIDECNKCVCIHTGYASCSLNDCFEEIGREKRSSDGSRLSDFVDENGLCKETTNFRQDCNTCFCQKGKGYSCTEMACQKKNRTEIVKRDSDHVSNISEYVNEKGRCKKQGQFKLDCNTCSCSHEGGYYFCTLMACPGHQNKLLRKTRDAKVNENGNSGLECKPGVSWKENCNSCFCSERGIAMCTDIPTCPSPPPAPIKVGSSSPGSLLVSTTPSASLGGGSLVPSNGSPSLPEETAVTPKAPTSSSQALAPTESTGVSTPSTLAKDPPPGAPLLTDTTTPTHLSSTTQSN